MKRYAKEFAAILLQIALFYILPLFGMNDPIGMVLLIIVGTFALSLLLGGFSGQNAKWAYPALAAAIFLPSVPVYYNESAVIHSLWYLVVSAIGIVTGSLIRALVRKCSGGSMSGCSK